MRRACKRCGLVKVLKTIDGPGFRHNIDNEPEWLCCETRVCLRGIPHSVAAPLSSLMSSLTVWLSSLTVWLSSLMSSLTMWLSSLTVSVV